MTATLGTSSVAKAIQRADSQWARRHGDDEANPDYLAALIAPVDQIVGKLGGGIAELADSDETEQLHADLQRQTDLVDELRKTADTRGRVIERQKTELDEAKSNRQQLRAELQQLTEQAGIVEQQKSEIELLRGQLAERVREINAVTAQLEEQGNDLAAAHAALEELAAQRVEAHRHFYVVPADGGELLPCTCGQEYPRLVLSADTEPVEPEIDPLDTVLDRVRAELKGWPA